MKKIILLSLLFCFSISASTPSPNIDSINTLHQALKTQHCEQIIGDYLKRILTYNLSLAKGAPINAFVSLNPSLLLEAQALDADYAKTGKLKGPLHCVPVIIKDNIDSIDTPSTSGSLALLGSQPNQDAFLVKRIKRAGGLIIGKGAMDELANGMSGISSKSGRVGNAYDPNRNPGGSSGGVAAAVSANFALVGIGTDNSGSIRIPAAFNRVAGLRPSDGLISQTGIFPRGNTDGVAGPIARNYQDLAILLGVIAAYPDSHDPKTKIKKKRRLDYTTGLSDATLKDKRIGIVQGVRDYKPFNTQDKNAKKLFQLTFKKLKDAGATLIPISFPDFDSDRDDNMAGEVEDINDYLNSFPSTRRNFQDICLSHRTFIFGSIKKCLAHIHDVPHRNSKAFKTVFKRFKKNRDYVQHEMRIKYLDALLMPISLSVGPTYDTDLITSAVAPIASNAGLPSITLLTSNDKTHPLRFASVELIGKQYDEAKLINIASAYDRLSNENPPPVLSTSKEELSLVSMPLPAYNELLTLIGDRAFHRFLEYAKTQYIEPSPFRALVRDTMHKMSKRQYS